LQQPFELENLMAKEDLKTNTATPAVAEPVAAASAPVAFAAAEPPRLGEQISVKVAQGLQLINNETGQEFAPDVATPVTVRVITLRRLEDGDLVRV
jgi:hypothetical protein